MSAEHFLSSLERWSAGAGAQEQMAPFRQRALQRAGELGIPTAKMEHWRQSGLASAFSREYEPAQPSRLPMSGSRCQLQTMGTLSFHFADGVLEAAEPLQHLPGGALAGSLMAALREVPELVLPLLEQESERLQKRGFFNCVNMALFTDGFFLHVPKGVQLEEPIQVVHATGESRDTLENLRNFIVLEEDAEATVLLCDHSFGREYSLLNTVNHFSLQERASLKLYRVQNLSDEGSAMHQDFFHQQADSRLLSHTIGFNGGWLRGEATVALLGEGADCDFTGLTLASRSQQMENRVRVEHRVPRCTSRETFKSILDDYAHSLFNGHVLVEQGAVKTEAYQNNNNIVLTDKAKMNSRPFLEIYADDVTCSHGSTVGQLDEEAMFYLRQRGISEENARLLLLYAFAADLVGRIEMAPLREQLDDMVKRRLRGELESCEGCVLSCSRSDDGKE